MRLLVVRTLTLGTLMAAVMIGSASADTVSVTAEVKSDSMQLMHEGFSLPVSLKSPLFTFEGAAGGSIAPKSALREDPLSGRTVDVKYAPVTLADGSKLDVVVRLKWSPKESILRKWARYRLTGKSPMLLKEVTLDTLNVKGQRVWTHGDGSVIPDAVQSHPFFMNGIFAGVEFPVSAARVEKDSLIIAHRPGIWIQPGTWYETRKAVYGAASRGDEIRAFERYIASHRPSPKGFHINYNSWWTSSVPFSEKEIVGLIDTFTQKLYKPYSAKFDTFCIDLGWSDTKTVWEINKELFPQEFTNIQTSSTKMNSSLGLWISPSSCYPGAVDNKIAKDNGYEASGDLRLLCLGGKKYQEQFSNRLVDMIGKYGIRHIKLDGCALTCEEKDHGHETGLLSSEKITEGFISACTAMRKTAKDVWLEPTCFGYNPSPWWLFHVNSLIGTFGDDAPYGRVPCPVYRESYTTARDYFNLQGAGLLPFPIAAQEVLGIVHQSTDPLMNDAVTSILRGHMFQPVYMNPKYMNDARWKSFAGLLTWARKNSGILQETEPLIPVSWKRGKTPHFTDSGVMPREPYGFAHCSGTRGLIMLRNPWIAKQSYKIKLDKTIGFTPDASGMSAVSIYPEPRVYAQNLRYGDEMDIQIAPYETMVLSIEPKKPVRGTPLASVSVGKQVSASVSKCEFTRQEFDDKGEQFGPDWTSMLGDAKSALKMDLEAEVNIDAPDAQLLLLLEGEKKAPVGSNCLIKINGKDVPAEYISSTSGWSATGYNPNEYWVFVKARIPQGKSSISVDIFTSGDFKRISAWVWATKPGDGTASYPNSIPSPELISLDSYALLQPTDVSSLNPNVVKAERPIERINGVFLDTIEPVSVTQGYGKLEKNQSVWEKPMLVGGKQYMRGLGTHANARIEYALDGKYKRFQTMAGPDYNNHPTITMEVWVDGQKKWESGYINGREPGQFVDINVSGAKSLVLVVGDGGNGNGGDHADWADAKLLY
ncbi:MAG: NPCBM/NEW2 domain-containing protein [Armatimonadota bacterium]